MKNSLKQVSIFFIIFFFVAAVGFAYSTNGDSALDNLTFLTLDSYQILPDVPSLSMICLDIDVITSFTLILAISTRAPPA
jgi:hypothetical protein